MSAKEIGCCGAYCKTCQAFVEKACKGCKIGYDDGERDISKAKCKIKVCCIKSEHETCSECDQYSTCSTLQEFYNKNGYKYGKYRQATEYIKENGYEAFFDVADKWKRAYGKY